MSCESHWEGWMLFNAVGYFSCYRSWLSCLGGGSWWSLVRWRSCCSQWWRHHSPLYIREHGQPSLEFFSSKIVGFWKKKIIMIFSFYYQPFFFVFEDTLFLSILLFCAATHINSSCFYYNTGFFSINQFNVFYKRSLFTFSAGCC